MDFWSLSMNNFEQVQCEKCKNGYTRIVDDETIYLKNICDACILENKIHESFVTYKYIVDVEV